MEKKERMTKSARKLTGLSLSKERFRLHETNKSIDTASAFAVLKGSLAAYRIQGFLPNEDCKRIVENFWTSEKKAPRLGYGEDGVEGYFLGASHIEKTTHEYLEEAYSFKQAVKNLYHDTINPIAVFRETLVSGNENKINIRPARFNGLPAGDSKAVYWSSLGDFLLQPHDDLAQLRDPRQNGFEIQQAKRVMAVNFYADVPKNAGQLKIWNIEPDDISRAALDLTYSGFPYPPELLNEFESITIPVEAGDLCVINGNLIHAVIRGDQTASSKKRLLVTCFIAANENNELIWWT